MEENNVENAEIIDDKIVKNGNNQQIAGAIIVAGVIIAGAIFLKGAPPVPGNPVVGGNEATTSAPAKVSSNDRTLGNPNAKVTVIMYEDFQCPFCERFFSDAEKSIRETYVVNGDVQLVYRDFAFLGQFVKPYVASSDESINAAEAARCAGDQGKFWEYHDYLYSHQDGENEGGFADVHLKEFAKTLGLNELIFNQCLSTDKYAKAVADSNAEAKQAGVSGTPKGFILKNGKVVDTIDGAQPFATVKQQIDSALK